jgi:hypothetical protein
MAVAGQGIFASRRGKVTNSGKQLNTYILGTSRMSFTGRSTGALLLWSLGRGEKKTHSHLTEICVS